MHLVEYRILNKSCYASHSTYYLKCEYVSDYRIVIPGHNLCLSDFPVEKREETPWAGAWVGESDAEVFLKLRPL